MLGGRVIKYSFFPLVYPEYKEEFDLIKIFNRGLLPPHFISNNARRLLQAYVEDYPTNEIRSEGYVRNISSFGCFLDSTTFSSGEMLNYSNIVRDVGVDSKTVKEYYQILVDTLVGYLIYPYTQRINRNIISHTPKFYFFDVGVANCISKQQFDEISGSVAGKALENYILMELVGFLRLTDSDYNLFYWRTNIKLEIDFILTDNVSKPIPIEVKVSRSVHNTELRALKSFMTEYKTNTAYVVCLEPTSRKIIFDSGKEILIVSVQEFLDRLWSGQILGIRIIKLN